MLKSEISEFKRFLATRGVDKVFIIDGTIPHAILIETLTDEGIGTMFKG